MKRTRLNKLSIENLKVAEFAFIQRIVSGPVVDQRLIYAVQVKRGDKVSYLYSQTGLQLYFLPSDARRAIRRINPHVPITSI